MACVFPFEYDGKNYTQCTDVDWDQLWCPIVVDAEGKYIHGDVDVTWGNCGNCTSDQDSCKTEDNVACVFPFEYDGNTYTECTDVDNKKKWCATAVDAQGRYIDDKWGYCGDCTPGQGK